MSHCWWRGNLAWYLGVSFALFFLSGAGLTFASGGAEGASPYMGLKPAFVVNYGGVGKVKYLKADISVRADDAKTAEAIRHHMPLIRNGLVLLFSRQTDESMAGVEGKEALRQEALTEINRLLAEEAGAQIAIADVFFNNLVLQK